MFSFTKPIYPFLAATAKSNPESAHRQLIKFLSQIELDRNKVWNRSLIKQLERSFCFQNPRLEQTLWGLNFKNPLGLAAGFDKDGMAAGIWSSFGFGFAELGAVTLHAQAGNPLPRMFRLPLDRAALNRMGANNLGAAVMAETLQQAWQRQPRQIPIGINLCKSKITSLEDAATDYLESFNLLKNWADYFVVNVSSPNTPGLRSLQSGEQLEPILTALNSANQNNLPIFIKIAPDLEWTEIAAIVGLAKIYKLSGIIATNTTTRRDGLKTEILEATGTLLKDETGGISGAPIKQRSTDIIRFIWLETRGEIPIIGVGGIFTPEDAWEKITAGASLLQTYTGWVYEGPWMVKNILEGLLVKLKKNGLETIGDAIGLEHR
jgi:dihydroorotate dehydrogenase